MKKLVVLTFLMVLFLPLTAQNGFVIDHTTADIHEIPQNWIDSAKAKLKIRYFRRSHGSHIDVGGMAALRRFSSEYAEKYNYNATGAGGALFFSTIWHSLDFENDVWVQITRDYLDDAANAEINVVMWAWSSNFYLMDVDQYLVDMEALIADYGPNGNKILSGERTVPVTFIFHTACGQKSLSRNELVFLGNQKIRQHCQENDRILFDFNDIENYNPDGEYFGDGSPDGTYSGERLLGDDCSYKQITGARGNWGIEWNNVNSGSELAQLSADNICVTCEHSMGTHEGETKDNSRLHCVLKGQAAWWLYAKLAGWTITSENVWTGNFNSDWNNGSNWSKGSAPTNVDEVELPAGLSTYPMIGSGRNFEVNSLVIQPGANLQIAEGNTLQVNKNLELNSSIDDYSQLIDNENISVLGSVLYTKALAVNVFHYLASPLANIHSNVFTNTPSGYNPNFYVYNEQNNSDDWLAGWDHSSAIGMLQAGRGYAYYCRGKQEFTMSGNQLYSGDISIDVHHSNNGILSDGWNLIGNPYPSAISADEFINENQGVINGTLYFWDDDKSNGNDYSSNDYALWNLAGAIGTGSGAESGEGTKTPDGFVAPMQGFFVRKTNPGTEQIWFRNSMRTLGQGQYFKSTPEEQNKFRLSLSDVSKTLYNEILIAFVEGASSRFDNLYDGFKLKGNPNIAFYSLLNDKLLGIQTFGKNQGSALVSKSVALGYDVSQNGDYKIDFVSSSDFSTDDKLYLEDKFLNKVHQLSEDGAYTFQSDKGEYHHRFVLHINPSDRLKGKLMAQTKQPKIYYNKSKLIIETTLNCNDANYTVYSLMGLPLKKGIITNNKMEIDIEPVYKTALVKIECTDCEYTDKVVLE
jgi:hypothetical protein